jgi:hypothetical protein
MVFIHIYAMTKLAKTGDSQNGAGVLLINDSMSETSNWLLTITIKLCSQSLDLYVGITNRMAICL